MDLIDRYLHAVRGFLPRANQEDVVRELSEELRSQAEEKEAAVGRPLTAGEQAEMLETWGHPLLLASRYQPRRHVVGPAVFPIYWLVLKTVLAVTLLVHVISTAVIIAGGRPAADLGALLFRFQPFLLAFAWVTLVFAGLERTILRFPVFARWDPSSLPEPGVAKSASLACRIAEIVLAIAFVLWLAAIPYNQWLMFGPAWNLIELGSPWFSVHLVMVGLASANLIAMMISLRHAEPRMVRSLTRIATDVCAVAILVYLVTTDDLIVAKAAGGAARLAALLDRIVHVGLAVGVVVVLLEIGRETFRLIDLKRLWGGWSPRRS